jgi:hypothetical protein
MPLPVRQQLRRADPWRWTTWQGGGEPDPLTDYLLESASILERPVPDHASVTRAGHGLNSQAVTWRMAAGPIAFFVQAFDGDLAERRDDVIRTQAVPVRSGEPPVADGPSCFACRSRTITYVARHD